MPTKISVKDLRLGDIIRLDTQEYSYATVRCLNENGTVQIVRPYIHCGDFQYTGGVITYIGTEDFALLPNTDVVLVRRGDKLK